MWRDFCCELQHVFISHAFGQGGGKGKGSCLQSAGSGEEVLQGAQRKEGGFGGGMFFGDQVELSDLL